MKKAEKLILDSGGTRTDCCILFDDNSNEFFSVQSYHPVQFSESFFKEMTHFWIEKLNDTTEIYFYGAGCSIPFNQQRLIEHFQSITSGKISVESDIYGACKTIFNQNRGFLCIMGTGSVAVEYDGEEIVEQFGGLGYLLGDEGSGYAVGKKLIISILRKEVPKDIVSTWPLELQDKSYLLMQVYGEKGKQFISSFTQQLPKSAYLNELHFFNIAEFFDSFKHRLMDSKLQVTIVGSYGYFHSELITKWFLTNNLAKPKFIQYPIQAMVLYHSKNR